MSKIVISASLLAAPILKLGQAVDQVATAGADWLHLDVMDHHYVDNLWGSVEICSALHQDYPQLPLDLHLMVEPVDSLIYKFANAGAKWITIHPDATHHLDRIVRTICSLGCKAGIALNPASGYQFLPYIADQISMILLISVNPGMGGQQFLPNAWPKIAEIVSWRNSYAPNVKVSVDGGINCQNCTRLREMGVDVLVAGSAIFGAKNWQSAVTILKGEGDHGS